MADTKEVTENDPLLIPVSDGLGKLANDGKPGKLAKLYGSPARKAGLALLFILFIVCIHYYGSAYAQAHPPQPVVLEAVVNNVSRQPIETDQGKIIPMRLGQVVMVTIDKSQWIGASNHDPNVVLMATVLSRNVLWQERLDGNNELIFKLDPANWAHYKLLDLPDSNVQQYELQPEDPAETASVMIEAITRAEYAVRMKRMLASNAP